jgi:hypothetical protein
VIQKHIISSDARDIALSEKIKAKHEQYAGSVEDLSAQSSTNHLAIIETMHNHREGLIRVDHTVQALQQTSVSSNARLEEAAAGARSDARQISQSIASMSDRLDGLNSISQDQYKTLQGMLEQLLSNQKVQDASDHPRSTTACFPTDGGINNPEGITEDEEEEAANGPNSSSEQLVESLHRLWTLTSATDTTFFSEDAQNIIDDLEKLLSAASEDNAKGKLKASRKRQLQELYDHNDADDLQDGRDLKRVRGLLTASQSIQLANKGVYLSWDVRRER